MSIQFEPFGRRTGVTGPVQRAVDWAEPNAVPKKKTKSGNNRLRESEWRSLWCGALASNWSFRSICRRPTLSVCSICRACFEEEGEPVDWAETRASIGEAMAVDVARKTREADLSWDDNQQERMLNCHTGKEAKGSRLSWTLYSCRSGTPLEGGQKNLWYLMGRRTPSDSSLATVNLTKLCAFTLSFGGGRTRGKQPTTNLSSLRYCSDSRCRGNASVGGGNDGKKTTKRVIGTLFLLLWVIWRWWKTSPYRYTYDTSTVRFMNCHWLIRVPMISLVKREPIASQYSISLEGLNSALNRTKLTKTWTTNSVPH